MDILDYIINETAEAGNGTVAYLEVKGKLHLISTVYPEQQITLFIVPKGAWVKIQKFFSNLDEDDEDVNVEELFWDKLTKYNVGDFEGC
jgi:hypothetical protein